MSKFSWSMGIDGTTEFTLRTGWAHWEPKVTYPTGAQLFQQMKEYVEKMMLPPPDFIWLIELDTEINTHATEIWLNGPLHYTPDSGTPYDSGWMRVLRGQSNEPDPIPFDAQLEEMCRQHDDHFWPHKNGCPLCGSDAYIGFDRVECCRATCQNWHYREGM